jgi:hypothetical protein
MSFRTVLLAAEWRLAQRGRCPSGGTEVGQEAGRHLKSTTAVKMGDSSLQKHRD